MDGGMNGRMSQPINKIDFFPIAAFSHGFISESLLLGLLLRTRDCSAQKGRAAAEVKFKGFGCRWTWAPIQALPRQVT